MMSPGNSGSWVATSTGTAAASRPGLDPFDAYLKTGPDAGDRLHGHRLAGGIRTGEGHRASRGQLELDRPRDPHASSRPRGIGVDPDPEDVAPERRRSWRPSRRHN